MLGDTRFLLSLNKNKGGTRDAKNTTRQNEGNYYS